MADHEALETNADPQTANAETRIDKKRNRVRSAWISFVGRIMAQLIGAAATILLGLIVVDKYSRLDEVAQHLEAGTAPVVRQHTGRPALAVLPVQDYSPAGGQGALADAITEAMVAQLAQSRDVRVVSRTSSMVYRNAGKGVPVIGRELGVDWIVESSIVRDGHRVRLISQLIDARTDEHLFARVYERDARDVFTAQSALAAAVAADVGSAIGAVTRVAAAAVK